SRLFGELEQTKVGTPGAGGNLIFLKNFDDEGRINPPSSWQILNNKANQFWHADSSFKANPAKASLLSGRVVPSRGGNTEYLSMRAVYAALPEETKQRIEGLVAIHDYSHSRNKIDPDLVSQAEYKAVPPVRQAMVLDHGGRGKSLYIGAHCSGIEGMSGEEGGALIDELMAFADQEQFVYSHNWRQHDLVLWDNRSVLHRATPFDAANEKRFVVRTTIAGDGPTIKTAATAAE
ncbi:MAG: TauD/TfdA family dioxygenase, partial [Pseudomonadota bacterium]